MKRRVAHAISWTEGDLAPRVIAQGHGAEVERLLRIAREAGVEIVQDEALALVLENVEIGALVPDHCWKALAEILAFVMARERT